MSQAGSINLAGGTPAVPTTFVTDSGNAVPVANTLNILGDDTVVYNANGITTQGAGDTVTVLLNNRVQGTTTTVGAVTADVITFDCGGTAGVFLLSVKVVGFDSATPSGCAFKIDIAARTDGAAVTLIDDDLYPQKEAATTDSTVTAVANGNDVIIRVLGVAGLNMNWSASGYYERVL